MAKKRKEISLDDLEEELAEEGEILEEIEEEEGEEEEEIEEIEEFSLEDISPEEEVEEIFEEEEIPREPIPEEVEIPEEEIIDERIYTIPLKYARKGPRTKWAKKAVKYLRSFMEQHFKPEYLIISQEVNEKIWERGIKKPPRKIRVLARKNIDGLVYVDLA